MQKPAAAKKEVQNSMDLEDKSDFMEHVLHSHATKVLTPGHYLEMIDIFQYAMFCGADLNLLIHQNGTQILPLTDFLTEISGLEVSCPDHPRHFDLFPFVCIIL